MIKDIPTSELVKELESRGYKIIEPFKNDRMSALKAMIKHIGYLNPNYK